MFGYVTGIKCKTFVEIDYKRLHSTSQSSEYMGCNTDLHYREVKSTAE